MIRIVNVVGARPNFIKIAPIMHRLAESGIIDPVLLHTGQHYDYEMSESFFKELDIPEPDAYLNVGSGTQAGQVARIMERFDEFTKENNPDAVLVVGDVNSTMACSLVAVKKGIKVIHVEAGIRSRDRGMPEEINRLVTDSVADILMPPSSDAVDNLVNEGHAKEKIHLVGNIMIDTLKKFQQQIHASDILDKFNLEKRDYALVTIHRPSNVDTLESFKNVLNILDDLQSKIITVFPIHPRTKKMAISYGLEKVLEKMPNLIITDPLGYFDFGKLVADSGLVLTDSGGIQEETTVYGIPCITLRKNTERPVTVSEGSNKLAGKSREQVEKFTSQILSDQWKKGHIPKYWDGYTADRIIKVLEKTL